MGHRPRRADGTDCQPVRRLDRALGGGPAVVHLTAATHGYLWYVDADTFGFWLDERNDDRQARATALRQLFQAAAPGARFDVHVHPDLHDRLHADLAWAEQASDDDRRALSIRTMRRWLHDGQLTLTADAHLPDAAAAYAAHAGELHARQGGRWCDVGNPVVDLPTGSQLRARAAAQGRTIVYTDGSATMDPRPDGRRPGGWAWWADADHHDAGPIADTTVHGVIGTEAAALAHAAADAPGDRLLLVTDALWLLNRLQGRRTGHGAVAATLAPALAARDIDVAWMPSHSDPLGHNLADRLANQARRHANSLH